MRGRREIGGVPNVMQWIRLKPDRMWGRTRLVRGDWESRAI